MAAAARPPLRLALACFGSALVFLLLGSAGLVWVVPDLTAGWFPLPRVVAVLHLFTLGWITLSMIAALHHFVPVALHTPLMSEPTAWLQLAAFDLGLAVFTAGEVLAVPRLALAGAILLGVALLAFGAALGSAMRRTRPFGRTAAALLAAALFLAVALTAGVLLALDRTLGWAPAERLALLSLHVRLALLGWVFLVLIAVAQRLLPMFLLTGAPDRRLDVAALALVAAGALAILPLYGRTGGAAWLPVVPAAAGVVLFLAQAAVAYRRSGRRPDAGLRLAGFGLLFLGLALAIAPFATGPVWQHPRPLVLLVVTIVLGALTLFVAGHYYRLVPFLVWTDRWAPLPPARDLPPSPDALYPAGAAAASLALLVAGAAILIAGVAAGIPAAARAGALTFGCGTALLAWQMLRVMTRRPALRSADSR